MSPDKPLPRKIIHVDMDAFYASVEQLDNSELKGKAVIVGGSAENRGVVSAASYEARKFGVPSAMPTSQARRLCPHGVFVPVRMDRYAQLSSRIHDIFAQYTDLIEPISLDEAFLDVTGSVPAFGPAEKIAGNIKQQIKQKLQLNASVGIAPNKFLAKLASDLKKPDGFVVVTEENKQKILDPLPVERLWGVGKVSRKTLKNAGFATIKQIRKSSVATLSSLVGNAAARTLLELSRGIDDRPVIPSAQAKSLSSEHTFAQDIADESILLGVLLEEVEKVAARLRNKKLAAKTVTLKLRYGSFRTLTRSKTLDRHTNTTDVLFMAAKEIFRKWQKTSFGPLRLIGFGASGLKTEGSGQLLLFDDPDEDKHRKLDEALDKIRKRYGSDAIRRNR